MLRRPLVLAALAMVVTGLSVPAAGQDVRRLLDARLGQLGPTAEYAATLHLREGVDQPDGDLSFEQHDLFLSTPIVQDKRREWSAHANLRALDFHTDARLPDTGEAFPDSLWNVELGTTYRFRTAQNMMAGFHLTAGSASDEPFDSEDELVFSGLAFLAIPQSERNAWVIALSASNKRQFLRYVPLPGLAYWYNPDERLQALLGLPVTYVRWQATDGLELSALYVVPRTGRARATFAVGQGADAYVGYVFDHQSYFRADRADDDDELTFYEQRVEGGLEFDLGDNADLTLGGGYAFNRFFYEGDEYDDRGDNRINFSDGPFAFLRFSVHF